MDAKKVAEQQVIEEDHLDEGQGEEEMTATIMTCEEKNNISELSAILNEDRGESRHYTKLPQHEYGFKVRSVVNKDHNFFEDEGRNYTELMQHRFGYKVCSVDSADHNFFEDVSFAVEHYMFGFKGSTAGCEDGLVAGGKELLRRSNCGDRKLPGPETWDPGGFLVGRCRGLGGTGSLMQKQAVSAEPEEEKCIVIISLVPFQL